MAGEASADELSQLDDFIVTYPDSIYYIEAFKEIWQDSNCTSDDLDDAFAHHLDKFQPDFAEAEIKVKRLNYWYIAACLVPLMVIGLVFYFKTAVNSTTPKMTEIVSGKAIRRKLVLPDGTQVWLNAESRISFNSENQFASSREVTLSGEAFFDVVKDKLHPFVVHTSQFSIKVLGTAFDVKAYPQDKHTEATLLRGKIELTVNDRPQQKIILTPNEKFVLTRLSSANHQLEATEEDRAKILVEQVQPVTIAHKVYSKEAGWVSNQLVISNERFEDLTPKLERWYNVKIIIDNPAIRRYKFTGIFKEETLDQALTAMALIEPFKFKINANEVKIY